MSSDENGFIAVKELNTILYIVYVSSCRSKDITCVLRPPILSFRLAEKKECAAPGVRKKRAPDADNVCAV